MVYIRPQRHERTLSLACALVMAKRSTISPPKARGTPLPFGKSQQVHPWQEAGAYEALWATAKATFKRVSEWLNGSLPSTIIPSSRADEYTHHAFSLLAKDRLTPDQVGICLKEGKTLYRYPDKLRDAAHPVELLYFRGEWKLVDTPSVAVVGTRKPTEEGVRRTFRLVRELVHDGFTIVSGLAYGVDTAAHTAALEARGRTIAVLGTPISKVYPKANRSLQEHIADRHLVISQVPMCRYAEQTYLHNRAFFPERNITMSALTEATIIVEASDTSGALIQARAAFHQGRKLLILESCFSRGLEWPDRLARAGAIRVSSYEEIRGHLGGRYTQEDWR